MSDKLIADNLGLAVVIGAGIASCRPLSLKDDIMQDAVLGLVVAARRYDPSFDVPFGAYAGVVIRGAVISGLRRAPGAAQKYRFAGRARTPISCPVQEVELEDFDAPSSTSESVSRLECEFLLKAAGRQKVLDNVEKFVIGSLIRGRTLNWVAKRLHMDRKTARRYKQSAISKLRSMVIKFGGG